MSLHDRLPVPIVPTLLTLLMLPVLILLGLWQVDRAAWKARLLAEDAAAPTKPVLVLGGRVPGPGADFRRARATCRAVSGDPSVIAGQRADGAPGVSYRLPCLPDLLVDIGWAARPDLDPKRFSLVGRTVEGTLVSHAAGGYTLVATTALPPLVPSRQPTLDAIPNNHMAYAIQWFSFAAILGAFYVAYVLRWRRARAVAAPGPAR